MTSPEEQTHMIVARGLTKVYGEFTAVDGIDFEVRKGEAFGLLGPNGAGKSTTMKMIASVSKRTGGELTILGLDPNKRGPEIRAHPVSYTHLRAHETG
jgi:lipooligosaccharide transport system ATP-binding protein